MTESGRFELFFLGDPGLLSALFLLRVKATDLEFAM